MRCNSREEPWGSHQVEARALKWEISRGLTEEGEGFGDAWAWLAEEDGAAEAERARNPNCRNPGEDRRRKMEEPRKEAARADILFSHTPPFQGVRETDCVTQSLLSW